MVGSLKHPYRRFLLGIALYLAFGSLAGADENPWQALQPSPTKGGGSVAKPLINT
jgi:hypothetical protein